MNLGIIFAFQDAMIIIIDQFAVLLAYAVSVRTHFSSTFHGARQAEIRNFDVKCRPRRERHVNYKTSLILQASEQITYFSPVHVHWEKDSSPIKWPA